MRLEPFRSALMLFLMLIESACGAGWHRIDPAPPSRLPEGQQVQLWQHGRRLQLHAVRLVADSISGVPFVQSPDCDSCRITLPRASVDSMKTGNPTAGVWKTTGLVMGGMLAVVVVACTVGGTSCESD